MQMVRKCFLDKPIFAIDVGDHADA